ncbi:unnamed protein product [Nippostrongylus brasiliensis]|uniref:Ovule protein n=1 Tax=Nippostrongylus brasiliensis TaxID=27835 RepID=A0A0N4XSQ0_NIPBR|nr:unnamed protein product [Nippostrongylus brasiliensis]
MHTNGPSPSIGSQSSFTPIPQLTGSPLESTETAPDMKKRFLNRRPIKKYWHRSILN